MPSGERIAQTMRPPAPDLPLAEPLVFRGLVSLQEASELVRASEAESRVVRSRLLPDDAGRPIPDSRRSDEVLLDEFTLGPLRQTVESCLPTCREHFDDDELQVIRPARLLRYRIGDAIGQHRDAGRDRVGGREAVRLVSFSILLSDPVDFAGGDLIGYGLVRIPGFERLGKVLPLGLGDAVFFPSRLQHEVSAVTRGTRVVAIGHLGRWNPKETGWGRRTTVPLDGPVI